MNRVQRLLISVPFLGLGAALAAVFFDPDLVNSTTYVIQPVGWAGMTVADGYKLDGNQHVFQIDYSSKDWTGNLHKLDISGSGFVSHVDNWPGGAKAQIETQNTSGTRSIVTMNGATKIPFVWTSLSSAQKTALDPTTAANVNASTSPVLDYIRGSDANESPNGNKYRPRVTVLGDIIHATPRYWKHDSSNATVFVGANDGMLHAINAADGSERFAYIPSMLIPKLPQLLTFPYAHKYFVDGQLAARKFGSQSILVGGLGGGGKGLFALDITTVPTGEADAATKILWEITNSGDFANLGHTYGTPVLTVLPDGTNVALVSNGYNNTGNGHATLFLINPVTGGRIAEIDTGSGTTASPNGLSSPIVVGNELDGTSDVAYAGDIDGKLWKFDLVARTATLLHTTSPAQAISMKPGVKPHPQGGYMVTFVTGRIFEATDEANNATHYAYGIWDRPAGVATANDMLLTQTLTEATFTAATPAIRVRTASNNIPDWSAGAGHHMGWKTALPIGGERVVADGAYVTSDVFVFLSTNPTINPSSFPPFENWFTELNALTGGDNGAVRFDLNGDGAFTDADKISNVSPVARHIGGGVRAQATEFLNAANNPIYIATYDVNGDPDITVTTTSGVSGGHFDFDSYYGKNTSNGTGATATITVGTTGQTTGFPATLGTGDRSISIDGVVIVPALTVLDLPSGPASATNAQTIKNKVTGAGGYTAKQSGSVVTITAPVGADYNGKTITITDGSSQTLVSKSGVTPTPGQLVITSVGSDKDIEYKCGSTVISTKYRSLKDPAAPAPPIPAARLDQLYTNMNGTTLNGYGLSCTKTVNGSGVTTAVSCSISAPVAPSACSGGFTTNNTTETTNTGPQGGVSVGTPISGWTNLKPALSTTVFSGGVDPVVGAYCPSGTTGGCSTVQHVHEYDDKYDRTGVNMLDPTITEFDLRNAIPSSSTPFKVLVQNQYLNPSTMIHLHGTYQFNSAAGYTPIKNFQTTSTLDVTDSAQVPTYTRANVQSLAINMPVSAFSIGDWWGNGDLRVGLQPTQTGCVNGSAGATDGNMFEPVIPFGAGDGYQPPIPDASIPSYGLLGYHGATTSPPAPATTALTAKGVRHNGALTIQVIKANTQNSDVEMSIPGHPEYGWRLRAASFSAQLLAEFTIFWHHPNGKCFGAVGWVKNPPQDTGTSTPSSGDLALAAAHTDPKIGSFGPNGSGAIAGTVSNTVTNPDGTTTTTTVTTVINPDGSATITTTISNSGGGSTTTVVEGFVNQTGGAVGPTGAIGPPISNPLQSLGRVNWRELFK